MDLYDIRGGRLGVIKEEAEYQESTTMERGFSASTARGDGALPRITEDSTPSPTGADDGQDDVEELKEEAAEVGTAKITLTLHISFIDFLEYNKTF